MSVINQMLKELDQRNAANHIGNNSNSGNQTPTSYTLPEESNHFKKIVAAIVIILTMVSVYYFKFMHKSIVTEQEQQGTQPIAIENSPVNVQPSEQKVVFEQPVIVAKSINEKSIEDIAIEEKNGDDEIIEEKIIGKEKEVLSLNDEPPRVVKSKRQMDVKTQAERLYKSARQKLDTNQFSEASELLEQAITIKSDFHNARVLQFSILLQRQQFDYLRQQVEASLQLWPEVHDYRLVKARLLLQQELKTEALVLLEKDIPPVSTAPEYHALLAYAAQQTQNDQLAKKHYQLLLQQQSNRADWWLGLAVSEERLGNKESALQAYEHAVERQGLSQSVSEYARQRIKALQGF